MRKGSSNNNNSISNNNSVDTEDQHTTVLAQLRNVSAPSPNENQVEQQEVGTNKVFYWHMDKCSFKYWRI